MKKALTALVALALISFLGYACDSGSSGGSSGGIVVESVSGVSGASAAKLYYPSNISSPTAATTMSAGYTQSLNNVDWLSRALASEGFVVLGLTPSNNWGMVSGWRDMHKGGISKLQQINSSHSVLRGKIDLGKLQTCGHSKGGGGSLWASSQLRGTLKTTVGMAPYREEFSNSTLGAVTAATFVQAGGSDTLATNSMTRGEYGGLGNISKKYVEYSGYGHLAWDGASGSTAARISGDIIAWMRYYMYGDTSKESTLANRSGTQSFDWVNLGAPDGGGNNGGGTGGTVDPGTSDTTTLQAENAAIVSGAVESEHSGYSGSGYANTDNSAGTYIEFTVSVTQAGSYALVFTYALESGNRYASVQVNGSTVVSSMDFRGTGAWTNWQTSSTTVNLSSGTNKIRLTAEQSDGLANIDKLDIKTATGN